MAKMKKTRTRKMVGYALKHVPTGLWWTGREWAKGKANAKVYKTWQQADRANDACRREPNLTVHLNTNITTVEMSDARTIAQVAGPQSRSGLTLTVPARLFIDCSGDGAVGVGAGVPFRIGAEARSEYGESFAPEEPDDFVMGSSLVFRARDTGRDAPFEPPDWAEVYDHPDGIPYRSATGFAGSSSPG